MMQVSGDPVKIDLTGPSPSITTVENHGPSTVYYTATQDAASAFYKNNNVSVEGSISPGVVLALSVSKWFICPYPTSATLDVQRVEVQSQGGSIYWSGSVATKADLPTAGETDGEARVVLADESQSGGPVAIYVWRTDSWHLTSGGGTSGGGPVDPEEDELPVVGGNVAEITTGDEYTGKPALILLGDQESGDFDLFDLVWINKWVEKEAGPPIIGQSDTWGQSQMDRKVEDIRQTYRRLKQPLPYGMGHSHLTANFNIASDTAMHVFDYTQFSAGGGQLIARGRVFDYTGVSSGSATVTGLSLVSGTASGILPAANTIVYENVSLGGWGTHTRHIDRAGEMYAAGFQLEAALKIHLNGSQDLSAMTVGIYWLNLDVDEDFGILQDLDTPTGGLGMSPEVVGPADPGSANRSIERPFEIKTTGWTPLNISTPTKRFLIPMVFAKMNNALAEDNGEEYGLVLRTRWVQA